jgi:r-opsin
LICELPVILAKTSCVYNPIIYALSHPKYREVKVALTEINQRNFIYFFYLFHVQCLKELYPWLCIVVETKKSGRHGGDDQSTNSTKTEASGTTQG